MVEKEDILSYFKLKNPKPQAFRDISIGLGLNRQEARSLKRTLRDMLHTGDLVLTRKGLYAPSGEVNLVRGYFEAKRDGFGFVVSDLPGQRDLFIPPHATMGAMDNDKVIARPEGSEGGRKGRIIRVLERTPRRVAGTLDKSKTACFIKPRSRSVKSDIYIPAGECAGYKNGQEVIAEIVEYPSDKRPPIGRILKSVEAPERPLDEIDSIIEEFSLPARFPKQVADEARRMRAVHAIEEEPGRKDLTRLPTVTIDGERARDFDDAVSIRLAAAGYRLWVHIADVSRYVPWESVIDIEARKRGTSVYFTDRVLPMLPKELSEDLCSLVPGEIRYAFTVQMDFDRSGKKTAASFYPSIIRSDERMTYTDVSRILVEGDDALRTRYSALVRDFELMEELAGQLRAKRFERGSLDFDLPEPEVLLDLQGRPEAIIRSERNIAHVLIEEFMIAANEAVAEYLEGIEAPSIYRIHEEPDLIKMEEVLRFAKNLIRTKSPDFRGVLEAARGTPEEEIINFSVLRSLKQARYSTVNAGHFGLASDCYTHFTSPIRRYPDLVVHRVLKEALAHKQRKKGGLVFPPERIEHLKELLPELAFSSSRMERNSDEAERAALRAMKAWFIKDKVGEEFQVKVIEVTSYGLRVRFEDFYVESFIHVSLMSDDFYIFNEKNLSLSGRHTGKTFRIGDFIRARIDRVDLQDKEIILGLI